MIGQSAREVLIAHDRGEDVAHQVSEMVAQAVNRALHQLNGGAPSRSRPLVEGGQYQFSGPVDDSPPAQVVAAPKSPPKMAEPPPPEVAKLEDMKIDEKPRSRSDSMPWVF